MTFDQRWRRRLTSIAKAVSMARSRGDAVRWYAVKLFERDEKVLDAVQLRRRDEGAVGDDHQLL